MICKEYYKKMDKEIELDIRIEARGWCGSIDTDRGASENQVENVALYFFKKGFEQCNKLNKEKADYTLKHLVFFDKIDMEGLVLKVKDTQKSFEEGYVKGFKERINKTLPKQKTKKE